MKVDTLNIAKLRATLGQHVRDIHEGEKRVIVEKNGIPVMALVSMADYRTLHDTTATEPDYDEKPLDREARAFRERRVAYAR